MKFTRVVLALLALGMIQTAHAGLIELRGGIGINSASPDAFNDRVKAASNSDLSTNQFDTVNADLFLNLPGPFGVGLRHEWINANKSSGGNEVKLHAKNFSVLADWRLIDTVVYVGPIVGIGYPNAKIDFRNNGVETSDSVSGKPSYSLGAEFGVHLAAFLVGAEAGYESLKLDKVSGANNNVDSKVDLSGFYGKVMVGLSFL